MKIFDKYLEWAYKGNHPSGSPVIPYLKCHGHKFTIIEIEEFARMTRWYKEEEIFFENYIEQRKRDDLMKVWAEE